MNDQRFGHDFFHAHARVQRGKGVLKDDLHVAAKAAQLAAAGPDHVMAIEGNCAGSGLDEAEKHASQSGLAAARFADEAQSFPLSDVERNTVHGADFPFGLAEHTFVSLVDLDEVKDGEQGHVKANLPRRRFAPKSPNLTTDKTDKTDLHGSKG
jgi:hypothetical protein